VLQAAETNERSRALAPYGALPWSRPQLQRKIRFAGSVQFRRPARIDRTSRHRRAAGGVRSLPAWQYAPDRPFPERTGNRCIGFEGGVRFELALPVSFLCLDGKEVIRRARWFSPDAPPIPVPAKTRRGRDKISSPIRANEAISAPPERNFKLACPAGLHNEVKISLTTVLRITSHKSSAAVRVRVTRVPLNYGRLRCDGQRLRCGTSNPALLIETTWGPIEHSMHEHAQAARAEAHLRLAIQRVFREAIVRKLHPGRFHRWEGIRQSSQH